MHHLREGNLRYSRMSPVEPESLKRHLKEKPGREKLGKEQAAALHEMEV